VKSFIGQMTEGYGINGKSVKGFRMKKKEGENAKIL
jgi:hypothetical protein